ncbi:MAG TPA: arylsulfatase [Emcibacteraceae bacterium]|nr:arylsulfatase [Emcibacteraceae bacterium]
MYKVIIFFVMVVFLTACEQTENNATPEKISTDARPNILLIVADDLGYSDIAPFGSEISTPNLDALAAGGIKMSNMYAAAACSPTRTMLLGGADSHRGGMGTMYNDQAPNQMGKPGYEGYLNKDVVTVSTLLNDAGYHTYMTGKWHLGYDEDQSPKARGFEKSFALLQGGSGHFDDAPLTIDQDKSWFREDGKRVPWPEHQFSSQFYTDKMIDYIDQSKNDGKPFFAYLAYTAPHWPLQAPEDYIDKYKGQYDEGYNVLTEKRMKSMEAIGLINAGLKPPVHAYPDSENWNNLSEEQKKIKAREMEIYAAMIDNMDYHIGRMLDYLDKTGQRENTIVIFMSDNGAAGFGPGMARAFPKEWIEANFNNSYENMGKQGSYIYYGPHWAQAGSAPSRMFKGFITEGGIKVPGIINYGDKIKHLKGEFDDHFLTVLDLPVTFLDLANADLPGSEYKGRKVYPYIGKSILPYLRGDAKTIHNDNDVVSWELSNRMAVRKGDWKIIKIPGKYGTGEWELFNIKDDPGETHDLSHEDKVKLAEMVDEWDKYAKENGVVLAQ